MSLHFVCQDITKMKVDAIVNAANRQLQGGSGVCGAIFKAAGWHKLQEECDRLAPIETGNAVVTSGGNLVASYIIHTAGPIYHQEKEEAEALLTACYHNSLKKAVEIAIKTICQFLLGKELIVYLVFFDQALFEKSQKKFQ